MTDLDTREMDQGEVDSLMESVQTSNITSLDKKYKEKNPKPPRSPRADMFRCMADLIDGRESMFDPLAPTFEKRYYAIEELGNRIVLRVCEGGIVERVADIDVANSILKYCQDNSRINSEWRDFVIKDCEAAAKFWLGYTRPIIDPVPFTFQSSDELTYRRIPFDPCPDPTGHKTPLFSEILGRVDCDQNRKALMAFIGSIFVPDSDRQQYLWLWGDGMNGKGSIIRLLARCLGQASKSEMIPVKPDGNNFWTGGIVSKRLVYDSDVANSSFLRGGFFKKITGGDRVRVELKQKGSFDTHLVCKCIFASNQKPIVSKQKSDLRRAIYVELRPANVNRDGEYENKLWNEAKWIIGNCLAVYNEMCPNKGEIVSNQDSLKDVANMQDDLFGALFDNYFTYKDPKKISNSEKTSCVSGQQLSVLLKREKFNKRNYSEFVDYLRLDRGIERDSVRMNNEGVIEKRYIGMFLKYNARMLIDGVSFGADKSVDGYKNVEEEKPEDGWEIGD